MAISRGGMGKEMAGARLKKRVMGASRQGKKAFAAGGVVQAEGRSPGQIKNAARDASFGAEHLARLQGIVANRAAMGAKPSPAREAGIALLQGNPSMTREQFSDAMNVKPVRAPRVQTPNVRGRGPGRAAPVVGLKKGGKVDFSEIFQNKKTGRLSEKSAASTRADYAKKMKSAGLKPKLAKGGMASKKGGMAVMIILGKGPKKSK